MNRFSTRKIILNGLMIALVFLATYFTRFPGPIPPGYINLGDAVIMIAAILFGRGTGLIAGAIGSALADIAVPGGILFAPITFVVKGIEGYIIGMIAHSAGDDRKGEILKIIAVLVGAAIMVAGYFLGEMYVLKIFDNTFGYTAARIDLPLNLIQGGISVAVGYALTTLLTKVGARRIFN